MAVQLTLSRCPQCAALLYDPQEPAIRGECLYCGLVVYTADRNEPFPRRDKPTRRERGR